MEQGLFRLAVPTRMPPALGFGLRTVIGCPGSAKTFYHAVSRIRDNLGGERRTLCMHPTANARSNSTRALHSAFPGHVRAIGCSNLSPLERGLTFDHMIRDGLRAPPSTLVCLAVSLKDATDEIRYALHGASVQTSDPADVAKLQRSAFDGVRDCHVHFLVAREHLEQKRPVCIDAIVAGTPIVVGTGGRMTGQAVRGLYKLGGSVFISAIRRAIHVRGGRFYTTICEPRQGMVVGF